MKFKKFFVIFLVVTWMIVLLFNCAEEVKNDENEQGSKKMEVKSSTHQDVKNQQVENSTVQSIKKVEPINFRFGALWPFKGSKIDYKVFENGRILTLNGHGEQEFGAVCWEREVRLHGNRTLEIEILNQGNSSFRSKRMLKVFICTVPGGDEVTLRCKNQMKQAEDSEFSFPSTEKFLYSLDLAKDDTVYKLGFTFFNARLEGFKLRARFVE